MSASGPPRPASSWKADRGWLVLVFLVAVLPYLGTLGAGFTNWDDPAYVTDNPAIRSFSRDNVSAWLFQSYFANRAPVHLASYALDHGIWGLNPFGYHLTNLLLQGLCAVLLWRLARRLGLTSAGAAAGALLFALHPAGTEAVAWVAERKTVLAACLLLGAILAYLRAEGRGALAWAGLAVVLFTLGVFSKVAVAPFPFVLIALHRGMRVSLNGPRAAAGLLSLLVAIGAGWLAMEAHQSEAAVGHLFGGGISVHAQAIAVTFAEYVRKLLLPVRLSPYYDLRESDLSPPYIVAGALGILLAALICAVLLLRRREQGFWLAGALLLWLPSSSILIPISTPMADRYLYLPLLFLGPLATRLAAPRPGASLRGPVWPAAVAVLFMFALLTAGQSAHWQSSRRLWERAVAVEPGNPWARQKLAYTLWKEGEPQAALAHAKRASAIEPRWLEGLETLGRVALDAGDPETAEGAFRQQIAIAPNAVSAYVGVARARRALGDDGAAFAAYLEALRLKRDKEAAAVGLYEVAVANGWEERALSSLPVGSTSAWLDLVRGDLLARLGRGGEAARLWRRILVARPDFEPALERLSGGQEPNDLNQLTGPGASE